MLHLQKKSLLLLYVSSSKKFCTKATTNTQYAKETTANQNNTNLTPVSDNKGSGTAGVLQLNVGYET